MNYQPLIYRSKQKCLFCQEEHEYFKCPNKNNKEKAKCFKCHNLSGHMALNKECPNYNK